MKRKSMNRVLQLLRQLQNSGVLEPRQEVAIERAVRKLKHAEDTQNKNKLYDAVNEVAEVFLRATHGTLEKHLDED